MRNHRKIFYQQLLQRLWIAIACSFLIAVTKAQACDDWVARAVAVEGGVEQKSAQTGWTQLSAEQLICPGQSVRVGDNSRAALYLRNNTFVRLDANSLMAFPQQKNEATFWVELSEGVAHFISRIVNGFQVNTPYVNAVVEGTEFIVSANQQEGAVSVVEGRVKAYNTSSSEVLLKGQQANASARDQALQQMAAHSDRVQWAIYYPPVLTLAQLKSADPAVQGALDKALALSRQNRPDQALQALQQENAVPVIKIAQAALLLEVGRADESEQIISSVLETDQAGSAFALRAVALAARNQADSALSAANRSVELLPASAMAYIALSYAQQASLQLDDALGSAVKATQAEPENTLAWLRLSELRLSQGDIKGAGKALETLDQAQNLNGNVQSAKGFVELFSLHLSAAEKLFRAALKADSANPQHHLGMGLTLLRQGELSDGRRELEIAASLDPLRSTLRSYLGRAYFEEKRDPEAIKQWELAKQYDPNDPTPYFYTGVYKLFENDPIGAIDELETSQSLNDKRAIYRSETLLQSDAASRSATLARAYNEVGYDQGVLLNGWDAIRKDPTNSEGHRLLADKYGDDPRYEGARVSELLQSQLWQPLSAYPLQPQLAEANMAVVAGAGPQRPGLNEYHSLFTQNGVYGMVNGLGGSDGTLGNDLVGSFLAGPVAVSLGQFHFESDGWRENADQQQDVYNGFVQWQVAPSLSLQYEHRKMEWDRGYLAPALGNSFDTTTSEETSRDTDRIGLNYRYSDSGAILLSVMKQQWNVDSSYVHEFGPELEGETEDSLSEEVQWVMNFEKHHFTVGGGVFDVGSFDRIEQSIEVDYVFYFYKLTIERETDSDPKLTTGYADYFYQMNNQIGFGLGFNYYQAEEKGTISELQTLYFDGLYDSETLTETEIDDDRTRWLPRLGMIWDLSDSTQLRLAQFSTVARQSIVRQSIETTNFLGFNKIYDDNEGTEAQNYAVAMDYRRGNAGYGLSLVRRSVRIPVEGVGSTEFLDQTENWAELYANLRVAQGFAVSVGAIWSQKKLDDETVLSPVSIKKADEYQFPIKVVMFGDNSVSVSLDQTYYLQDVDTVTEANWNRTSTWITDAAVRYRLDKRFGTVSAGVKNLLGEEDEFLSFSERELAYYPGRLWFASININL